MEIELTLISLGARLPLGTAYIGKTPDYVRPTSNAKEKSSYEPYIDPQYGRP
ncbi:hypothetical protein AM10699_32220 [Acaryochloris marina MBIC10699]|nr:hypothetical protein AM10699_32220 [Acaryochloris marina MBIC10699]